MVVNRQEESISHHHVRDLPNLLEKGDCLVLNDTMVVAARLLGHRVRTGGRWEGLYLKADENGHWWILCKSRGKLQPGESIALTNLAGQVETQIGLIAKLPWGGWLARPESKEELSSLLARVGRVPLPRYIRGSQMVDADWQRYQTVYAKQAGAVAAPTAGLHFTDALLAQLRDAGVATEFVTLHVGLGTFNPIGIGSLSSHVMHREAGMLSAETAHRLQMHRRKGGRIVAVGTTTVRLLESAAADGTIQEWSGETDLFIRPPYTFKAVDALLTNFHLPRTTLLVLACTLGGHDLIFSAYEEAIRQEYRLYSYGDAMLIL